ncbi:MAG: restriction endonuclease [Gemmatimonadetes bacterium]|nr:restriction endonuclease [Gemmatimonadota bacterium]MYG84375.1 restriction endonuclease [Gemmatimonadota bacterium]MYJ88250.1 restriction endonuclease [Gemmatimonadota bacterium]
MPVPDHYTLMLPILKSLALADTEMKKSNIREDVIGSLALEENDLKELTPSGGNTKLEVRFSWAITFMLKAGLVERVKHATYKLTEEGKELLSQNPSHITVEILRRFESFRSWGSKVSQETSDTGDDAGSSPISESPVEHLEQAYVTIKEALKGDILNRVYNVSSSTFEHLVLDLLTAMGYGGPESGEVIGGPGDKGIDCIISEDKLGLDKVYVQAKRFASDHKVGTSDMLEFGGALDAKHASKGIFVTTSDFTPPAREVANQSPKHIVLIDGDRLAELMVDYDVGVREEVSYTIKRIDEGYFEPE